MGLLEHDRDPHTSATCLKGGDASKVVLILTTCEHHVDLGAPPVYILERRSKLGAEEATGLFQGAIPEFDIEIPHSVAASLPPISWAETLTYILFLGRNKSGQVFKDRASVRNLCHGG